MKSINTRYSSCFALLAGLLLPFAFAPFHLYYIAFISPAILLYLWLPASPKQAFCQGLLFGVGFFGLGVSWVYISIHQYGNAGVLLSGFITALFACLLALFIAFSGFIFSRFFKRTALSIQCFCVFPALWLISEWCRSWVGTGFPWLFLGYSQMPGFLSGYAALFGVYGVSLIVTLICGALVLFIVKRAFLTRVLSACLILGISLGGLYITPKSWTTPAGKPIKASLIQGNVPQSVKWNPNALSRILQHYQLQTEPHWNSQLIVWPEAAIPTYPQNIRAFIHEMNQAAKGHDAALLIGAPLYDVELDQSFNGLLQLGKQAGRYVKRHLVPFGEYIPLAWIFEPVMQYFDIPMSGFTPGPKHQSTLIAAGIPIAPFICYEIAYPINTLSASKDKQLILVISDDSWFGNSMASPQQLQMAQMRARETGRPILYDTNTGITASISSLGQVEGILPVDQPGVLTTTVTPMLGKTPLMCWEYYPVVFLVLLFLGLGLFFRGK